VNEEDSEREEEEEEEEGVYWPATNECRSVGTIRCRVALPLGEEEEEEEETERNCHLKAYIEV